MADTGRDPKLDAIVNEVVSEAHISRSLLLPEEIQYIREHALNKPLGVIHIWALGVGVVITGEYFGWNFGLPVITTPTPRAHMRSEERRVGKECRSWWSP